MEKDLFKQLPDGLFRPLASQNHRLHWLVLVRLYNAIFEDDIEESEYGHAREHVVDNIEHTLGQFGHLWAEQTAEEEKDIRTKANMVFHSLCDNGWFKQERYAYNDYVSMPPRVGQTLAALIEISEGRALVVSGVLKNMRASIFEINAKPEGQGDRLIEITKEAKRFSRHLNSIRGAIQDLYEQIKGDVPAKEIVQTFFEKFLREIFIRDYAAIKTTENPLSIRDELLTTVNSLRYDQEKRSLLIKSYQTLFPDEKEKAEYYLDQDLSRLESVFSGVDRQLDAIDRMQLRYSRRVDTVIEYHTRSPLSIGKDIHRLIGVLTVHENKFPDHTVRMPLNYHEKIGEVRFQAPRQKRTPPTPTVIKNRQISEATKMKLVREREARQAILINDERLLVFLETQLKHQRIMETQDFIINNVRDYFCLLNIQRIASFNKGARQEFRQSLSQYAFTPTQDWVESPYISTQKVIVTRMD